MIEVKREEFMNEVYELKEKYNIDIKDFEDIYRIYEGKHVNVDPVHICEKVLNNMFGIYSELLIPYTFIISNVGRVIVSVSLGINNRIYLISDLVELTGFSKQKIFYDINVGNIKCEKKKGAVIFYEKDVNDYLKKKALGTVAELKAKKYIEQKEEHICSKFEREEKYGE